MRDSRALDAFIEAEEARILALVRAEASLHVERMRMIGNEARPDPRAAPPLVGAAPPSSDGCGAAPSAPVRRGVPYHPVLLATALRTRRFTPTARSVMALVEVGPPRGTELGDLMTELYHAGHDPRRARRCVERLAALGGIRVSEDGRRVSPTPEYRDGIPRGVLRFEHVGTAARDGSP